MDIVLAKVSKMLAGVTTSRWILVSAGVVVVFKQGAERVFLN